MTDSIDCIALVTARGGSKRVPGKNVRELAGKPLIAWSIVAARQAASVRRVIVSTDDPAIAAAARAAGAETPFTRPLELAGDTSSHYDVIAHAIDWIERDEGRLPDYLVLLQPTSPLRIAADIDATVELVRASGADSGLSVARVTTHPALMYRLTPDGAADPYLKLSEGYLRSQDMEPLYYVNGAAYVLRPATFRQRSSVLGPHPAAYAMPGERSIDIDEEHDFLVAEALLGSSIGG